MYVHILPRLESSDSLLRFVQWKKESRQTMIQMECTRKRKEENNKRTKIYSGKSRSSNENYGLKKKKRLFHSMQVFYCLLSSLFFLFSFNSSLFSSISTSQTTDLILVIAFTTFRPQSPFAFFTCLLLVVGIRLRSSD